MFNWMRTHQRNLMLVITILTIVAFVVLYNTTQIDQLSEGHVAKLYGKTITIAEVQKAARMFELALALGLTDYAKTLDGSDSEAAAGAFAFNSMILKHEARQLGIAPSADEIRNAITQVRAFQTEGAFDPKKYLTFIRDALGPRGFSEVEVEEIVRDSLALDRVKAIVQSPPTVTAKEAEFTYRAFQKASGLAALFDLKSYLPQVKVTGDEIEAAYAVKMPLLMTPELRAVRYVTFELPEADRKLEGAKQIEALQKIADASSAFAEKAGATSLEQAAKALGLKVETTPDFTSATAPVAALAPTSFLLTKDEPLSGVIQDGNKFHVIELVRETPSRQMTLDESRAQLTADLKASRAQTQLEQAADAAIKKIREAVKAGKTFAQAAADAGVKTRPFTEIAPLADQGSEDDRQSADATILLKEGEISGFIPQPTGGFFASLDKRLPIDKKDFAERQSQIEDFILTRKQSILFYEWLDYARKNAELVVLGSQ